MTIEFSERRLILNAEQREKRAAIDAALMSMFQVAVEYKGQDELTGTQRLFAEQLVRRNYIVRYDAIFIYAYKILSNGKEYIAAQKREPMLYLDET